MIYINKKYRTESGLKVRLLTTDGEGRTPVVGYIHVIQENGYPDPILSQWLPNGCCHDPNLSLVEDVDENLVNATNLIMAFRDWQRDWDLMISSKKKDADEFAKEISEKYEIKLRK